MSVSRPDGHQPAARDDGDAAAQRLGVAEDVRAEEHRPALVAQLENQRADVAAAERIEPGHRLVEEDQLRVVEQRLRDADALHHPLRELPQLQAPLGADARPRRAASRTRRPAIRRAVAEQPREVRRAAPRPSGSRRSTGSPGGSRSGVACDVADRTAQDLGAAAESERPAASAASASSSCRRRWARESRRPRRARRSSVRRSSAR